MVGMRVVGRAASGDFAGHRAHGLDQPTGHPADCGKKFTDRNRGQSQSFGPAQAVFSFAGRSAFQFVIHLVTDPASFINGFLHGENKAWDGLVGQVIQTDFLK